jgi:hypothetical protein
LKHKNFENGFCTGKLANQNALFCARVAYFWPNLSIKISNLKTFDSSTKTILKILMLQNRGRIFVKWRNMNWKLIHMIATNTMQCVEGTDYQLKQSRWGN